MASAPATINTPSGPTEQDEYSRLIDSIDWDSTYVGNQASWPQELNLLFHLTLLDPQPRLILIGPERTMLYNPAYAELIGSRHPGALGSRIKESFPDTYTVTTSVLDEVIATGRASIERDYCMPLVRNGLLREVHMSWIVVPFPKSSSIKDGFSVILRDESEKKILERRFQTTQRLIHDCASATDISSLWNFTISSLTTREHDCPFALLYAPKSDFSGDDDLTFHLQGSVGYFGRHAPTPSSVNLASTKEDVLTQRLREAMVLEEYVLLDTADGSLPEEWAHASKTRGWNDSCTQAMILPIRSGKYHKIRGLLILGLSTRTPYDVANKSWLQEIGRVIGDSMTSIRKREITVKELALREKEVNKINIQYQRLIKVIAISDVGIFECDNEGNLLQANESWFKLSGYPSSHLPAPAFEWLEYVHPKDRDLVMENWHSMMKGNPVTYEMRWKDPDQPEGRWILAVCLPILDDNGRVTSISGCTTDIEAQKKVENDALQALKALERASSSEQRFLRFTSSSPVAVHILELPSKQLSYCNDAWFEMTGYPRVSPSQVKGTWTDGIHEDDIENLRAILTEILATKEPRTMQFRFRRMWVSGDGHRYQCWGSSSSHPELAENGTVKAIMTTTTDISHLKWAEEVQRSRVEEALEAKRQQEQFIDMTSHEIRNPLGAVVHCADAIGESLVEMKTTLDKIHISDEDAGKRLRDLVNSSEEAVSTITSCSAHQKRIVDDLLTLSKLDSNLLQINQSPVRALSILDDMQRIFEIEAERAGIELKIQADPSIKDMGIDTVMLDTGRIHQILINLVTNAIKFTKDRFPRVVSITMGASLKRSSEDVLPADIDFILPRTMNDVVHEFETAASVDPNTYYIWFTVHDTGRGITADEKAKLFNRFVQGSPRTYSKYGGSGLGLFISRELAELQGGEIGVATELGKGSTFAFFVKTKPAPPSADSRLQGEFVLRQRRFSGKAGTRPDPGQTHVMVVEDNKINQRVLKQQLSNKGYQVWTADNGQEALDFLRTTKYWRDRSSFQNGSEPKQLHVVLMDIEMPVMDGLTAAKKIREFQKDGQIRGHVPILSVSANARPEQTSMAIAAGMDDSIAKPFRIVDLLPKIDRLAELGQNR